LELVQTRGAELVKDVGGIYHFEITDGPNGEKASWTLDLKVLFCPITYNIYWVT
jgi:hypothetical protein